MHMPMLVLSFLTLTSPHQSDLASPKNLLLPVRTTDDNLSHLPGSRRMADFSTLVSRSSCGALYTLSVCCHGQNNFWHSRICLCLILHGSDALGIAANLAKVQTHRLIEEVHVGSAAHLS